MAASADHYAALGVPRTAAARDIKRAFYARIKDNPPEQKPREFQRLREAFDVLSDPIARAEYDNRAAHGDAIQRLQTEAEAILARDAPDFPRAETLLAQAVRLGPDIGALHHLLARAATGSDRHTDALGHIDRALAINPGSAAYQLFRATVLQALGRNGQAATAIRAVWDLDRADAAAPRALARLYHETGKPDRAIAVLDEAIAADGRLDFQDFLCLFDKVHILLLEGDHARLRDELDVIVRVTESPPDRRFAAHMLSETAGALYRNNAFSLSRDFLASARTIDPTDTDVAGFADAASRSAEIYESMEAVLDGRATHPVVKELVRLVVGWNLDLIDEATFDAGVKDLTDTLDFFLDVDPDASEIARGLRRLKVSHPAVFALEEGFIRHILEHAAPTRYRAPCPHCGEKVTTAKRDRSAGTCPQCNGAIVATGTGYTPGGTAPPRPPPGPPSGPPRVRPLHTSHPGAPRPASPAPTPDTTTGWPTWAKVLAILFVLWLLSNC